MPSFETDSDRTQKARLLLSAMREAGYEVYLKNGELRMKGPAGERKDKFIASARRLKNEIIRILGGLVEKTPEPPRIPPEAPVEWIGWDFGPPKTTTFDSLWKVPWLMWRKKMNHRLLASYFSQPWNEREGMIPDVS